jgi:alkylhydroperoxidase/carboxymuconolactone decarboxylase family protein YurZ
MLRSFHGEFHDFVLSAAYGRILTRPGLTGRQRELLATGALQTLQQVPQLVAHARGALTLGATETEVREALYTADPDEGRVDDAMRRILRRTRSV